jgi:hypothetical protein
MGADDVHAQLTPRRLWAGTDEFPGKGQALACRACVLRVCLLDQRVPSDLRLNARAKLLPTQRAIAFGDRLDEKIGGETSGTV